MSDYVVLLFEKKIVTMIRSKVVEQYLTIFTHKQTHEKGNKNREA